MLRLEALFQSTGGSAGFTSREINEMSERLAVSTMASASDMRNAAGVLMTFKSISGEVFEESLRLTQDIGAVMGTSAVSGAKQLGKALEDPTTNMTALTRAGISFTDNEKERIKTLQESGRLGEAQAFIIETLKNQVGGAGTGGGLSGAIDLLADNFAIFNRKLAEETGLAKLAEKETSALANAIGALNDMLTETPEEEIERLENELSGTISIFGRIQDAATNAVQAVKLVGQARSGMAVQGGVDDADDKKRQRIQELQDQIAAELEAKRLAEHEAKLRKDREKKEAQQRKEVKAQENRDALTQLEEQILTAQGLEEEAIVAKQSRDIIAAENEFNNKSQAFKADIELLKQFRDKKIQLANAEADEALQRIKDQADAEAKAEKDKADKKAEREKEEAERAAEKREALEQGFLEQKLQAEEHEATLQNNLVVAHQRKMDLLIEQQEEELENADQHNANITELEAAHRLERANLAAEQAKETVKIDEKMATTQKKIQLSMAKSVLSILGSLGSNSKKVKVAMLAADVAIGLAENKINTEIEVSAARSTLGGAALEPAIRAASALRAASIVAAGALKIHNATSGGGGSVGGGGSDAALQAPTAPQPLENLVERPTTINLTIDNSIDPEGARRIVEAINEVTGDGLMINAVAI